MTRMIKTSRQDIHVELVQNAESDRSENHSDGSATNSAADYIFRYQYELFSVGLSLGYLYDEQIEPPQAFSQDIRRMKEMKSDNPHRLTIDMVNKLIQIERGQDSMEDVWEEVLLYADAGVKRIYNDYNTQDDFDLVRYHKEADPDTWKERMKDSIGAPEEVDAL